ncbi:MAG: PIN domain-containing protein [Fibromonadales bacterium]|nr:PIN domain-containing protein [Fibromonadales bacterium]
MKDKIFVDTNIFVYAYSSDDIEKHNIAKKLLQKDLAEDFIVVSVQILNEFYSVMSKSKLSKPSHQKITNHIKEIIKQTDVKSIAIETVELCLKIKDKYHYSWWDSLVLASALENDCKIVYSEDMQHEQVIENTLKIVNPFAR